MEQQQMRSYITSWYKPVFIIVTLLCSHNLFAECSDDCSASLKSCQQSASGQQNSACQEQFEICNLICNRDQTQSCVFLAFKNHEGVADKEKELEEITGGFARVTEEQYPHFAGLCSNNNMRCDYVLEWNQTMYSCGGSKRDPNRVACCR